MITLPTDLTGFVTRYLSVADLLHVSATSRSHQRLISDFIIWSRYATNNNERTTADIIKSLKHKRRFLDGDVLASSLERDGKDSGAICHVSRVQGLLLTATWGGCLKLGGRSEFGSDFEMTHVRSLLQNRVIELRRNIIDICWKGTNIIVATRVSPYVVNLNLISMEEIDLNYNVAVHSLDWTFNLISCSRSHVFVHDTNEGQPNSMELDQPILCVKSLNANAFAVLLASELRIYSTTFDLLSRFEVLGGLSLNVQPKKVNICISVGCKSGHIYQYRYREGILYPTATYAVGNVQVYCVKEVGDLVVTGGWDGKVRINGLNRERILQGECSPVLCVYFSGDEILAGHYNGTVSRWEFK